MIGLAFVSEQAVGHGTRVGPYFKNLLRTERVCVDFSKTKIISYWETNTIYRTPPPVPPSHFPGSRSLPLRTHKHNGRFTTEETIRWRDRHGTNYDNSCTDYELTPECEEGWEEVKKGECEIPGENASAGEKVSHEACLINYAGYERREENGKYVFYADEWVDPGCDDLQVRE